MTTPRSKRLGKLLGICAAILLCLLLLFYTTPWPSAMLIHFFFERGNEKIHAQLEKHRPAGVGAILNQQYIIGDEDAHLDAYFPAAANDDESARYPTIVWVHGGGWLSGSKRDAAVYFQLMAAKGYTVIALDYSLAPEAKYPRAVQQVNKALAFIMANAERFHVDAYHIVLAGDSAGAQITSQIALLVTNPAYAELMQLAPALQPGQLRAVLLWCGFYDIPTFLGEGETGLNLVLRCGSQALIWAYTGERNPDSSIISQLSTIDHVTERFPPTFISGGNDDPLTDAQSVPFVTKLRSLGVPVTTLFFPKDHTPALGHEYQFNLDTEDAQSAFVKMMGFVEQQSAY